MKKILVIVGLIAIVACAGVPAKDAVYVDYAGVVAPPTDNLCCEKPKPVPVPVPVVVAPVPEPVKAPDKKKEFEALQYIYFDFDKSNIKPSAELILARVADFMKKYPELNLSIEARCDIKGTVAYNMKLGNKRAANTMKTLKDLGVAPARMKTKVYGKNNQLPQMEGESKADWMARNRTCHLILSE